MGHAITALLLKGEYDKQKASDYDLQGIDLGSDITMFFIDHYYSACWQAILKCQGNLDINGVDNPTFPSEYVLSTIMDDVSKSEVVTFAIITTNFFGGYGTQHANVYRKDKLADRNCTTINQALAYLGVEKQGMDEFDTVGLSHYRSNPDYLDKYMDMADELGV